MKKSALFSILAAAAGIATGIVWIGNHNTKLFPAASRTEAVSASASAAHTDPQVATQVEDGYSPQTNSPAPPAHVTTSNVIANPPGRPEVADRPLVINGYTVQNPAARLALSFVGSDPEADACWIAAINDPDLPAEERKDLIEDLNEDGLVNPHLATPEDLPIIAARLRLIEELVPQAKDQVNADAFAEAYKDLANLYNGLPAD